MSIRDEFITLRRRQGVVCTALLKVAKTSVCATRVRIPNCGSFRIAKRYCFSQIIGDTFVQRWSNRSGHFLGPASLPPTLTSQSPRKLSAHNRRHRPAQKLMSVKRRIAAFRRRAVHVIGPLVIQTEQRDIGRCAGAQGSSVE